MTTFTDLGLPTAIVHTLKKHNITTPFPIQEAAIPDILNHHDVLGRGPTGSGKTFTFGLPALTNLAQSTASRRPGHPRALILAPTRELAIQIHDRLADPAAAVGLRILTVVGGVNIKQHIRQLAAPVDLLVATPGRAQDLIDRNLIDFDAIDITIIDEADHMADMGFLPQVRRLLQRTPRHSQRLLFSATLDGDVEKLVHEFMHNPITHSTAEVAATVDTMTHYRFHVGNNTIRNEVVLRIAARTGKTIMFMRTKHGVDRQVKRLRNRGINAVGLHGDKGQTTRQTALTAFTIGDAPVLVATDIAARGIDISNIDLVVHIDPPAEFKAYLHRAGRTARAGARGTVITLVTDEQQAEVTKLLTAAGVTAQTLRIHPTSPELTTITGAREPTGKPIQPKQPRQRRPQTKQRQHRHRPKPKRG